MSPELESRVQQQLNSCSKPPTTSPTPPPPSPFCFSLPFALACARHHRRRFALAKIHGVCVILFYLQPCVALCEWELAWVCVCAHVCVCVCMCVYYLCIRRMENCNWFLAAAICFEHKWNIFIYSLHTHTHTHTVCVCVYLWLTAKSRWESQSNA